MSYSSFKLKSGSSGTSGSSGRDGYNAANTFFYKYSTTTSAADPGDGYLRLNNATMGSATALYIANTDGSTPANNLVSFLEKSPEEISARIENEMNVASAAEEFEKAAKLRAASAVATLLPSIKST